MTAAISSFAYAHIDGASLTMPAEQQPCTPVAPRAMVKAADNPFAWTEADMQLPDVMAHIHGAGRFLSKAAGSSSYRSACAEPTSPCAITDHEIEDTDMITPRAMMSVTVMTPRAPSRKGTNTGLGLPSSPPSPPPFLLPAAVDAPFLWPPAGPLSPDTASHPVTIDMLPLNALHQLLSMPGLTPPSADMAPLPLVRAISAPAQVDLEPFLWGMSVHAPRPSVAAYPVTAV